MQELSQLPDNDVTAAYADAMAAAVQEYGIPHAVVLFVVQPGEKNSYDQQACNPSEVAPKLPHLFLCIFNKGNRQLHSFMSLVHVSPLEGLAGLS